MNEEEFVKDFNRTIGKLEGIKLTEHKGTPLECLIFDIETIMCEVEALKNSVEEALKEATNED